jgi:hypothetical protein
MTKKMETTFNPLMSSAGLPSMAGRLRGWLSRLTGIRRAADAPLRLEARLNLGPKKSLVLVDCCGKRLLLAVSGDAIQPVTEIAAAGKRARMARSVGKEAAR